MGWRNDQNKSYISWWVIQLYCWWLFQLKTFSIWKYCLKLSYFENQIQTVQTKSYRTVTKTKVVDLDELYNFVVDDFSIWNHLLLQNIIWISYILKFKFYIVQSNSDGEMTKRKMVDLNEF